MSSKYVLACMIMFVSLSCATAEYSLFDNEYFSVEYPTEWTVKESQSSFDCAWTFNDKSTSPVPHQISIGIDTVYGEQGVKMFIDIPESKMNNGTFNESFYHFFETLKFKF